MMESEQVKAIMKMYQKTKSHKIVMRAFGLNDAQEYAINIFGRDNNLSPEILTSRIDAVKVEMTIGEVAIALGFPAEMSLRQ